MLMAGLESYPTSVFKLTSPDFSLPIDNCPPYIVHCHRSRWIVQHE